MSKLIYLAITCVVLCFLSSCSEESSNELKPKDQTLDYKVENGMLCFKDSSAMLSLFTSQVNLSPEEIEQWEQSIAFESYNTLYDNILSEYEAIANLPESFENELKLIEFISTHSEHVYNSKETIEGLIDYSIEPKTVNNHLMHYMNPDGAISINNKVYNFKSTDSEIKSRSIISLKSTNSTPIECYKGVKKRNVRFVYITSPANIFGVTVYSRKKFWAGWRAYRANVHWKFSYANRGENRDIALPTIGKVYTARSVKSGDWVGLINKFVYTNGKIWNSGVKENNACEFSTPL